MELHNKITISRIIKNDPQLGSNLLNDKFKQDALKQLAEQSKLSEYFLDINFSQVRSIIYAQGL